MIGFYKVIFNGEMVSVIVPTLNEADIIESSLRNLLSHNGDFEVIVSNGGSSDSTLEIVSRFPQVKRVLSERGRGKQMNEGAKLARGGILLFLHADTCLPPYAFQMIEEAMSDSRVVGGSFCINFDYHSLLFRVYSLFSRINHILFTYGDQGLFVRRDTFRKLGGFKDMPIMEDIEIQKRLRGMGRFVKICKPAVTSARRFKRGGMIRQQILNITLVSLYHLGIPPSNLKHLYRDI